MKGLVRILVVVLGLGWTLGAFADEVTDEWGIGQKVAATEIIVAASATWAASKPKSYGVTAALLFPAAAMGNPCRVAAWTSLLGAEAIAADAYFVNTDKFDYHERFWRHVAAWHIFGAVLLSVESLACPSDSSSTIGKTGLSMGIAPTPDGTQLLFNYHY